MLDYLMMRPEDQALWQHNQPGMLRYLVVDELHTFDGAIDKDTSKYMPNWSNKTRTPAFLTFGKISASTSL